MTPNNSKSGTIKYQHTAKYMDVDGQFKYQHNAKTQVHAYCIGNAKIKYMKCIHGRHKAKCFKKSTAERSVTRSAQDLGIFSEISSTLSAKIADCSTFRPRVSAVVRGQFEKERNNMIGSGLFLKKIFAKRSRPDTCRSSRFLPVRLGAGLTAHFSAATFFIVAFFGIQMSGVSKAP